MSEIVLVARMWARPGREEEAKEVLMGLLPPSHEEHGVILYSLHQGVDDPSLFVFVEQFASRGDLDRHLESEHVRRFQETAGEVLGERPPFDVLAPLAGGDPVKGLVRPPT